MKRKQHTFRFYLKSCLLLILAIFVTYSGLTIAPYFFPKNVSESYKETSNPEHFSQNKVGPDRVKLIEDSRQALEIRLNLIQNAKESIYIIAYRVYEGDTTDLLFAELLEAADRGVKVKLIFDGNLGQIETSNGYDLHYAVKHHPNIEYIKYNKFSFFKPTKLNAVIHDKFFIIDHQYALLGGRNLGDQFLTLPDAPLEDDRSEDRDVFVYNTQYKDTANHDSVIYELIDYAEEIYNSPDSSPNITQPLSPKKIEKAEKTMTGLHTLREESQLKYPTLFKTNPFVDIEATTIPTNKISLIRNPSNAGTKEPHLAYELKQLALASKKRVQIQTPYATANRKILSSLTEVNENNIDVELLTNSPGSAANIAAYPDYYAHRKKFIATGTTLHEYQGSGSLHGKLYLFDERLSTIGSFNLDNRSINISMESMLVIDSEPFYQVVNSAYQDKLSQSLTVGENNEYLPNETVLPKPISLGRKIRLTISAFISRIFRFLI